MAERSYTYNSIANSLYGVFFSAITVLLNFAVRIFFVRGLGDEINGLHSLFQSISSVMMLMEAGISTAMVIHLYEPVRNRDADMIKGIMAFYKQVYTILAIVFTACCLVVDIFFMDQIVSSSIPLKTVQIYFAIFTLSFTVNYLTYYKRSILFAEQKNRISMGVTVVCEVVFRILQILLVLYFHNYIIFLVLTILEKLVSNVICNKYVEKYFPYLRGRNRASLAKEKKKAIFDTIKPLLVNQVAGTVQQSSKSILISILLGNISIVGYYGTYQFIISAVELVYSQLGGAFTSSFGNMAVSKDTGRMQHAYMKAAFIMNWLGCIICAGFAVCARDFVMLFFGGNFDLGFLNVAVLTVGMGLYILAIPVISVQNAMGLHKMDAICMIVQAVVAVALGYVLGRGFGMAGILSGLFIPYMIFTVINKGRIICTKVLDVTNGAFAVYMLKEIMKMVLCVAISLVVCARFTMPPSLLSILVKGIVAVIVGIGIPMVMEYKSPMQKEIMNMVLGIVKRKV